MEQSISPTQPIQDISRNLQLSLRPKWLLLQEMVKQWLKSPVGIMKLPPGVQRNLGPPTPCDSHSWYMDSLHVFSTDPIPEHLS